MRQLDLLFAPKPDAIDELIARGALFVINHSGGKDSQAMTATVRARVPADQILVVHALLEEVDWEDCLEHIEATIDGLPLVVARPASTFFEMVDRRGMFPSPANRQCTSDLKRTPIDREIRRYLKANPRFGGLVVSCEGMRAEESTGRARLAELEISKRNSIAGREWWHWRPIHAMRVDQVFATIAAAGQEPHWAYAAGMSRLSCCFCIMASAADLAIAARLKPALYRRYCDKERELGFTLSMTRRPLPEVTGINPYEQENAQ